MKNIIKNGVEYLTFKRLNALDFIEHGFSTRKGGVSTGDYSTMNLRLKSNDQPENIEENFDIFLNTFNLNKNNTVLTNQVHGKDIIKVDGYIKNDKASDGLMTSKKNLGLMTFHADCIPVYFVDPKKKVIGLVHSGWGGTLEGVSLEMIFLMKKEYTSNVKDIIVGIGPGIEACCYEVGKELHEKFINKNKKYNDFFQKKSHKYMLDLKGIIHYDLVNEGVLEENIEVSNLCTKCNKDLFFSHRGQGLKRGGMAAIIKKVR